MRIILNILEDILVYLWLKHSKLIESASRYIIDMDKANEYIATNWKSKRCYNCKKSQWIIPDWLHKLDDIKSTWFIWIICLQCSNCNKLILLNGKDLDIYKDISE